MLGESDPLYIVCDDPAKQEIVLTGLQKETYLELKVKGPFYGELSSIFAPDFLLALHDRVETYSPAVSYSSSFSFIPKLIQTKWGSRIS